MTRRVYSREPTTAELEKLVLAAEGLSRGSPHPIGASHSQKDYQQDYQSQLSALDKQLRNRFQSAPSPSAGQPPT
jgi:hypothetical protein